MYDQIFSIRGRYCPDIPLQELPKRILYICAMYDFLEDEHFQDFAPQLTSYRQHSISIRVMNFITANVKQSYCRTWARSARMRCNKSRSCLSPKRLILLGVL